MEALGCAVDVEGMTGWVCASRQRGESLGVFALQLVFCCLIKGNLWRV